MKSRKHNMKKSSKIVTLVLALLLLIFGTLLNDLNLPKEIYYLTDIPAYSDQPYIEINGNIPYFTDDQLITDPFEIYSELDELNRCGAAFANLSQELMPTEKRESIGMIKPTGWQTVRYDDLIEDKYLYNRCHLIAFQLAGENANELNLITGTRYMNLQMLPFENEVAEYIKRTNYHVLYRVTPIFEGNDLVARGVQMEAKSVEDDEICFNVFIYNIQPGIVINYADGTSSRK